MSRFKRLKVKILTSFLIFGLLAGGLSFWMGKTDPALYINPPGVEISEVVYNKYLIPYWESTLEPIGYEHHPSIDLETGEIIGVEDVPQYDFPLKKVSDLYIPITLLFWGIVGLVIQLIYNAVKGHRGLPR